MEFELYGEQQQKCDECNKSLGYYQFPFDTSILPTDEDVLPEPRLLCDDCKNKKEVNPLVPGARWVFINKTITLHFRLPDGSFLCGILSENFRHGRFLEDYEMCEKCVKRIPKRFQKLLNTKVTGLREWAMKNDKELNPEIFDMKPNELFSKIEKDIQ